MEEKRKIFYKKIAKLRKDWKRLRSNHYKGYGWSKKSMSNVDKEKETASEDKYNKEIYNKLKKMEEKYYKKYPRKYYERNFLDYPVKNSVIISFKAKNFDLWRKVSPSKFIEWILKKEDFNTDQKYQKTFQQSASIPKNLKPKWKKLTHHCKVNNIQIADFLEKKISEYLNKK